jgi:hypothetical protein
MEGQQATGTAANECLQLSQVKVNLKVKYLTLGTEVK